MHPNIPQCQYIKVDGCRCGSPALRGQRFCYFHYEVNRPTVCLDIPPLEDANAIQQALTDIARAVADDRLDLKRAAILGFLLQVAAANLKRVQIGVFKDSMIRELPEQDPYLRGVHSERGDEAARREAAAYGPAFAPAPASAGPVETPVRASPKLKSGT